MLRSGRIVAAFLIFLSAYSAIFASWPFWRAAGLQLMWQVGNEHLSRFGEAGRVHFGVFRAAPEDSAASRGERQADWRDTTAVLGNAAVGRAAPIHMSLRNLVFAPAAVMIALLLATPGTLLRRVVLGLLGVSLAGALGALRVWIALIEGFSGPHELAVYRFSDCTRTLIVVAHNSIVQPPASIFVLPLFVWLLIAFRLGDWVRTPAAPSAKRPVSP